MKSMDQDRLRTTLTQAIARAWTTPPNTGKAMDPDLVSAAVDQIMALAEAPSIQLSAQDAIEDALINCGLTTIPKEPPEKTLNRLITCVSDMSVDPRVSKKAAELVETARKEAQLPRTPTSRWRDDPHGTTYDVERAQLALGKYTDDELANGAFMNYDVRPPLEAILEGKAHSPIAWMTAVKDRIRWLSRSLDKAINAPTPKDLAVPGLRIAVTLLQSRLHEVRNTMSKHRLNTGRSQRLDGTLPAAVNIGEQYVAELESLIATLSDGITEDFDSRAPVVERTAKHNPLG